MSLGTAIKLRFAYIQIPAGSKNAKVIDMSS